MRRTLPARGDRPREPLTFMIEAVPTVSARASVTGVFFLNGALFSGWYARIPAIREALDLSPGELGIALLGAPAGLLLAQPVIGAVAARRGSRPLVALALVCALCVLAAALAR